MKAVHSTQNWRIAMLVYISTTQRDSLAPNSSCTKSLSLKQSRFHTRIELRKPKTPKLPPIWTTILRVPEQTGN
jgi:hypothetical protein